MGYPIFPGENEQEQFLMFMEILGVPDSHFVDFCPRKKVFFDGPNQPKVVPNSRGKIRSPATKDVNYFLRSSDNKFINFVERCFTWDAKSRMTPAEGLVHEWILDGLPNEIRIQHLQQMAKTAPELDLREKFEKYNIAASC